MNKIACSQTIVYLLLPIQRLCKQPITHNSKDFKTSTLYSDQFMQKMILSGRQILTRHIIQNLLQLTHQQQPCGIDLTLRQISSWSSPATIDFDSTRRIAAKTSPIIPFPNNSGDEGGIKLEPGAYLVDFNETVSIPTNCMGSVFPRSSLWRSGVTITAGVVDAGYEGAVGAMMQVLNPCGVVLYRNARVAQIVVEEMAETVEGYKGIYQGSKNSVGRDGV